MSMQSRSDFFKIAADRGQSFNGLIGHVSLKKRASYFEAMIFSEIEKGYKIN